MIVILMMEEAPDILLFFGRFHALVVHLPIGFLSLAIVLEIIFRKPRFSHFHHVIEFVWLVGALSATLSVVLGYFLSLGDGYDEDTLWKHKWAGIYLAAFASVFYLGKKYLPERIRATYFMPVSVSVTALLLFITGHFGGSLTHGSNYLAEHAPTSLSDLFSNSAADQPELKKIRTLDSADVFADAIMPIMKSRCASCHNKEKKKGELIVNSFEDIMKGGETGPAVVAGSPENSEIYRRITLPHDHKEFMPADGKKPLTEKQVTIIKWWIENKAPRSAMVSSLKPDEAMTKTFESFFELKKNLAASLDINAPPADHAVLNKLKDQGFIISPLSNNSNLLEAKLTGKKAADVKMKDLLELKQQLVWMQLTNCGNLDADLQTIGQLSNLRRLNLNSNIISDDGIKHLLKLDNLESLNLFGTGISDSSIVLLMKLKNLKTLYIWQTKASNNLIDSLVIRYPKIRIIYKSPDEIVIDTVGGKTL